MNLQEALDKLKPYLIGIRYVEGVQLIDVILKPKWVVPVNKNITASKGKDDGDLNYYMIYSENPAITLDHLLDYIGLIIKVNVEKENKLVLLKSKVAELQVLFQNTPIEKLAHLTFTFKETQIEDELDLQITEISDNVVYDNYPDTAYMEPTYTDGNIPTEASIAEPITHHEVSSNAPRFSASDIDGYDAPIEENTEGLSEEELEMIEEEKRAERNRAIIKKRQQQKSH